MARLIFSVLLVATPFCFARQIEDVVSFNFGRIGSAEAVTHRFVFTRRIESMISLCECLELNIREENGKYIVEARFDPNGYRGNTSVEAVLLMEGGRKVRIKIYADVEKKGG